MTDRPDATECPSCGESHDWDEYVRGGRCPECGTGLQVLFDMARSSTAGGCSGP